MIVSVVVNKQSEYVLVYVLDIYVQAVKLFFFGCEVFFFLSSIIH